MQPKISHYSLSGGLFTLDTLNEVLKHLSEQGSAPHGYTGYLPPGAFHDLYVDSLDRLTKTFLEPKLHGVEHDWLTFNTPYGTVNIHLSRYSRPTVGSFYINSSPRNQDSHFSPTHPVLKISAIFSPKESEP